MSGQEKFSAREEVSEIEGSHFKEIITDRSTTGVSEPYTETYGNITFRCEGGYNDSPNYSFDFSGEAQISFRHQNSIGSDKIIYLLEALSRKIPLNKAVDEIYEASKDRWEEFDSVLNPDDTLEEEYREDLSRLLEEEFWKDEEEGEEYGFQVS